MHKTTSFTLYFSLVSELLVNFHPSIFLKKDQIAPFVFCHIIEHNMGALSSTWFGNSERALLSSPPLTRIYTILLSIQFKVIIKPICMTYMFKISLFCWSTICCNIIMQQDWYAIFTRIRAYTFASPDGASLSWT